MHNRIWMFFIGTYMGQKYENMNIAGAGHEFQFGSCTSNEAENVLTHCGLVITNGIMILDHHWFRW